MDPLACIRRLLLAAHDQDKVECYHACGDLSEWLARGGFLPKRTSLLEMLEEFTATYTQGE